MRHEILSFFLICLLRATIGISDNKIITVIYDRHFLRP